MEINERIVKLLAERDKKQNKLAEYIKVAASTFNNWIKLNRSIPSEYIIPICEFIEVSPEYLLTGKEPIQQQVHPFPQLSENQRELLKCLDDLTDYQQGKLVGKLEEMAKEIKSNTKVELSNELSKAN